jgi:hypothetical protein
MISTAIRRAYLLFALFLISSSLCLAQEEESLPPSFIKARGLPYPGIIHIHSYISQGGVYPFRRLVSLAQDKGIKILVFSDTFLHHWEYGLPVLSNIFKVSTEERSVVKYGIKNYLKDLKKIRGEFPDMLILEGVEVAPFYWWSGSPFKKNLSLNDWSKHLLVIGLKSYQDYAHLPVVGNRYSMPQLKDVFSLLAPAVLVILGIVLLRKRKPRRFLGFALNIAGILFLFNLLPFSASRYSPYHGQKQFFPYQDLINYVNKKGGLVFWAHPMLGEEKEFSKKFFTINFYTLAYPESLMLTSGYAGFGTDMQATTSDNLILAGGEWDKVLKSYCQGKSNQPVWVIGEADYRSGNRIDSVQNIFFLSELNPQSAFEALRNGKLYVRSYSENSINISLHDFHIEDSQNKNKFAFMGDKVKIIGRPRLCIKGDCAINPTVNLKVEMIRDGKIIKEFEFTNEKTFNLEFQDDSLEIYGRKSYYRLNFFADGKIILVTNPIFIELRNE